jgi:hypothetical protein
VDQAFKAATDRSDPVFAETIEPSMEDVAMMLTLHVPIHSDIFFMKDRSLVILIPMGPVLRTIAVASTTGLTQALDWIEETWPGWVRTMYEILDAHLPASTVAYTTFDVDRTTWEVAPPPPTTMRLQ